MKLLQRHAARVILSALTCFTFSMGAKNSWAQTPESLEQSLGFYSKGSLMNANRMADVGSGFLKLYLPRNRGFASLDLIQVLEYAADQLSREFSNGERLQIGDISAQSGGWISGHASHQNGLDADLVYPRMNHVEQSPEVTTGFQEKFVFRGQVSRNLDVERTFRVMQLLTETGRINRIFLDPAIKNRLCAYSQASGKYPSSIETLRRLRPLDHHADHFHVRITCPAGSPRCVNQQEVAPGSGCPGTLEEGTARHDPGDVE